MLEHYSNQANSFLSTPSHLITVSFPSVFLPWYIWRPVSLPFRRSPVVFRRDSFEAALRRQRHRSQKWDQMASPPLTVPSWEAWRWEVLGYLMRASLDRSKYLGLSLKRLLFLKPSFVENWIVLHCAFKRLLNFTGEKSDPFIS